MSPEQLYEAANRAVADAIRYAQQPQGGLLSKLRRNDAEILRAMARAALRL